MNVKRIQYISRKLVQDEHIAALWNSNMKSHMIYPMVSLSITIRSLPVIIFQTNAASYQLYTTILHRSKVMRKIGPYYFYRNIRTGGRFKDTHGHVDTWFCFRAMLCISAAYAVVQCLSVTFVYCVETAKDTDIVESIKSLQSTSQFKARVKNLIMSQYAS